MARGNEDTRTSTHPARQLADELSLQAWLAAAELRNPSVAHPETRKEIDALAAWRDELKLQAHLGKLDAMDAFDRLETRWEAFKSRARLTAEQVAGETDEAILDLLDEIRDGYRQLRGT